MDILELIQDDKIMVNTKETTIYLNCLSKAHSALKHIVDIPEDMVQEEKDILLTSYRNMGLAHNSDLENAFMGNLNDEPTVTKEELQARGIKENEAQLLIDKRDNLRSALLGLI